MTVLLAIFVFCMLVFLHELGHFVVARLCHVTVHEFSIGMGPVLVSYTSKKSGILYALRMLPFGGYVSMAGENEDSDDPNALNKKPAWQRFLIIGAGATMNILTGIILSIVFISGTTLGSRTVGGFQEPLPNTQSSSESGIEIGDEILSVNGKPVHIAYEAIYAIMRDAADESVEMRVRRGDEVLTLNVAFPSVTEEDGNVYGYSDLRFYRADKTVGTVLYHAFHYSMLNVRMIWDGFFDLITGHVQPSQISGPVGIATEISEVAKSGDIQNLLYIVILISINLGVFNLLPIPALDGGRLFFILIEIIARKPVPEKFEGLVHGIGLMVLLGLSVIIMFKDIAALIG